MFPSGGPVLPGGFCFAGGTLSVSLRLTAPPKGGAFSVTGNFVVPPKSSPFGRAVEEQSDETERVPLLGTVFCHCASSDREALSCTLTDFEQRIVKKVTVQGLHTDNACTLSLCANRGQSARLAHRRKITIYNYMFVSVQSVSPR